MSRQALQGQPLLLACVNDDVFTPKLVAEVGAKQFQGAQLNLPEFGLPNGTRLTYVPAMMDFLFIASAYTRENHIDVQTLNLESNRLKRVACLKDIRHFFSKLQTRQNRNFPWAILSRFFFSPIMLQKSPLSASVMRRPGYSLKMRL
jgi:hypothetical protein